MKPAQEAITGPAERRHVIVTFRADEGARALVRDTLGGIASLMFMDDVVDERRRPELERADAMLSWDVGSELRDDDWAVLSARSGPSATVARPDGDRAPRPLLIQTISAGVDHVPFKRIPENVVVAGNAGGWAEPMAEHVLAMILALAKRLLVEQGELRRGVFNRQAPTRELRGGTCAILGFGGIGRAVAHLVRALGMRVFALNAGGTTAEPVDFVGTLGDLEQVLRVADVIVVTLPLTATSRGLIGSRELGWMRPDAILVNVARGPIIDEEALYRHLLEHAGFSAGLDVWWDEPFLDGRLRVGHPFVELPNFLGSPHNSGIVDGWFELGLGRATKNVRRYLLGEPFVGLVRREDYAG